MSIAQHGEIMIIINSSPGSQNLSPRVRVQRVKSPQSPLQILQLTYYCIYRLLVLFKKCVTLGMRCSQILKLWDVYVYVGVQSLTNWSLWISSLPL